MFPFLEYDDDGFLIFLLLHLSLPYCLSFGICLALRAPCSANFAAKLIEPWAAHTPSELVNVILASSTLIVLSLDLWRVLIFLVASPRDTVL
jgi:hypothetical protein